MSRKTVFNLIVLLLVIALFTGTGITINYYSHLPERLSQHETILLGQNRLVPGSQSALRLLVRDSKNGAPLQDARVQVSLRSNSTGASVPLFSGATNAQGTTDVVFRVPEDTQPDQTLVVETQSKLGSDRMERPVTVKRDYRVLLTTDKPIYQPGQLIHVRALALSTFDLKPAARQTLEITIADGKGNKVFRKPLTTSSFGAAATDFQLASEVNTGPYKITAVLDTTSSEKTVTVEHYVLPKYAVKLQTDRKFYLPGQHVHATLNANYFFGKPVVKGMVQIEGFTFDVQRQVFATLQGSTDDQGSYEFDLDLPGYIAGTDLEGGQALVYLQASVTDQTQHVETSNLSLPVAGNALKIEAVPEGGVIRQGVENIVYLLTSYPDGTPAQTSLTLTVIGTGETMNTQTGQYGLAKIRITPKQSWLGFNLEARDPQGNHTSRQFGFEGDYVEESVLLRPEKPIYQVGETMNLTILTSQPTGTVYLDIVRQGQTMSTRSIDVKQGQAQLNVDLTPDLYGTLELHAYKILTSGAITRDTRLVVVDNADQLLINLKPGKETYRPGEKGSLDILVTGKEGQGVESAVGLAVVDESVFALAETDPGFARLYFLLEQEIMKPRYDLHGFTMTDLVNRLPSSDPNLNSAAVDAAQASLADVILKGKARQPAFNLVANSHQDAVQRANTLQTKSFNVIGIGLFGLVLLIPLAMIGLVGFSIYREKHLMQSMLVGLALALALVLLYFLWPLGSENQWVQSPLDRLGVLLNGITNNLVSLLGILALAGVVGFLGLVGVAIARKEVSLGWLLGLLVLFTVALGMLVVVSRLADVMRSETQLILVFLAFLLIPLAFTLRFAGYAANRRILPALASLPLALFLLLGFLPLLALSTSGAMGAGAPMMFDGNALVDKEAMRLAQPVAAPAATQAPAIGEAAGANKAEDKGQSGTAAEPPRLRQYFPETMLWLPDGVTGPDGTLRVDIPMADSITTWRVTALASSQDGRLGSASGPLRVFQDFFIDLDLPQALTTGDEVAIPVGVFNYLPEDQQVTLELEKADWFELLDEPSKSINIASNDINVVHFRIRALKPGSQPFKVTANGSKMSDAILKQVRVFPNGKPIQFTNSDRLAPGKPVHQAVSIPLDAIPGTQSLVVKIYPGIVSQVIEGLDSILRMPNGCFEQTSSSTYPNLLVMDYLKTTQQASPEVQMKAEEYINLGYQRLTVFEVGSTGGFSLFGDAPADRMLTAYGLQEFSDMSRVHDVDPALVKRAAEWLLQQQSADGSWENDRGLVHESTWQNLENDRLPVTAYITWSLIEAGFGKDPRAQKGLQYIREFQAQAKDPYVMALVANALVANDVKNSASTLDKPTQAVLDRLAGLAVQSGDTSYWQSEIATFMGSEGQVGSIETTAMAANAFLRANSHPDLANAALVYLIHQKDSYGTWHSTQATVLSLKALLQSVRAGADNIHATVKVTLNGSQEKVVNVTPETFDVVQLLSFSDINIGRENVVDITTKGQGSLMYQVSGGYYLPWDKLAKYPELAPAAERELVSIDLVYDRTELAVNDIVNVNVTIELNKAGGRAESAMLDLGLPPGFTVQTEDLDALVARFKDTPQDYTFPTIKRYELTGRQILVYIQNISDGNPLQFSYRLRARFPLKAQAPASSAYDYYNPNVTGESQPMELVVKE